MKTGDFERAITAFTMALSVSPGSEFTLSDSMMQSGGSSPSEQEEETALFNLACCYSKLGELDSGLAVLRGLLELPSFDNFTALWQTPDIQEIRNTAGFFSLMQEFDREAILRGDDESVSSLQDSQDSPMAEYVATAAAC